MLGEPREEEARERVGRALPQPEARLVSLGTGRAGRLGTQSADAAAARGVLYSRFIEIIR